MISTPLNGGSILSWLKVDWEQKRPSDGTTQWLWRSVQIRRVVDTPAAVEEYLAELREVNVNGGAAFARFEVEGNRDFDWFVTRNHWEEIGFWQHFLTRPEIGEALPEVTKGARLDGSVAFEWKNALTLDGDLACILVFGGAYYRFKGSARRAKDLGRRVCDSLFGDRFAEIEVFRSTSVWSSWFYGVAWDNTWLILDRGLQQVSILASTDTD